MKFTKMHGAGNDYLYIDARQQKHDWPALARAMSDRHFGVGSDGIILVLPSDKARVQMRMFNADGSEGEMCGNGIRCFVRYAMELGIVPPKDEPVQVETKDGVKMVTPMFRNGQMIGARVSMGEPRFHSSEIPVVLPRGKKRDRVWDYRLNIDGHPLKISCVSMGNPHAVAFLEQPVDDFPLHLIGPKVEHHSLFPKRSNFEIVNVLGLSHLKVRVWERGSGLTLACGTGACAVAVASRLHGYTGDRVDINLPGGTLGVQWAGQGQVVLEGPVEEVFEGEWPD